MICSMIFDMIYAEPGRRHRFTCCIDSILFYVLSYWASSAIGNILFGVHLHCRLKELLFMGRDLREKPKTIAKKRNLAKQEPDKKNERDQQDRSGLILNATNT